MILGSTLGSGSLYLTALACLTATDRMVEVGNVLCAWAPLYHRVKVLKKDVRVFFLFLQVIPLSVGMAWNNFFAEKSLTEDQRAVVGLMAQSYFVCLLNQMFIGFGVVMILALSIFVM